MFNIREYVEFNAKGRADCPSCALDGKPSNKNLSLVPNGNGAYKCFRGCTPEQIRAVLGVRKDQQQPASLAAKVAPKNVTVSPQKVREASEKLLGSDGPAKAWLHNRGITDEMIAYYRLGVARCKIGRKQEWAIAVPIPNPDATAYWVKKRVCPWSEATQALPEYQPWKQFGIPQQIYFTHKPEQAIATWLCEGEWDAIRLGWHLRHQKEIAVACFTCGCGSVPGEEQLARLPGQVIIWYDLDEPGRNGAEKAALKIGDRALIATVPHRPNPPPGWDVSNALAEGFCTPDFEGAVLAAVRPDPRKKNPLKARLKWNDDLIDNAPDYTDFLVPDLLTEDELFLLAAGPRTGKSLFAMTLAKEVASGGEFLGRPCTQGTVIYVKCEDGDTKIKEREEAQGWSRGLPVAWMDNFKLSEVEHLDALAADLDPRLIVLDTLSRIKDSSVSESSAEMSQLLEPLQELAKRRGCCILVVHHTGKVGLEQLASGDIFEGIRGSSAIRAVCRGAMVLAAGERDYRLVVEHGWGKHDLKVVLDANTLTWKLLGNWNPTINGSHKELIIEALKKLGEASIDQLHAETGIPKKSLYEQLSRLQGSQNVNEKVVKKGSRRRYVFLLAYIQHIQQLNKVLNSPNPDVASDEADYSTKNNFSYEGQHQKGDLSSDERIDHPKPPPTNAEVLNSGFNPNQGAGSAYSTPYSTPPDLLNIDGQKTPETPENSLGDQSIVNRVLNSGDTPGTPPTFQEGDRVEILSGQFYGKRVEVIGFEGDRILVRGQGWCVTHDYLPTELKLIMRTKDV